MNQEDIAEKGPEIVAEEEIKNLIRNLHKKKAPGHYEITNAAL